MKRIKVVLVDDEPIVISDMLSLIDWEAQGCDIKGYAYSAEHALELVRRHRPDLVFVDVALPGGMDGLQFSAMVKDIRRDIVVVVLSGYMDFDYAKRAIDIGVFTYLVKHQLTPQSLIEVLERVRERMDSREKESGIIRRRLLLDLAEGTVRPDGLTPEQREYLAAYKRPFQLAMVGPRLPYFSEPGALPVRTVRALAGRTFSGFVAGDVLALDDGFLVTLLGGNSSHAQRSPLHHACGLIREALEGEGHPCAVVYKAATSSLERMPADTVALGAELGRMVFSAQPVAAARPAPAQAETAALPAIDRSAFLNDYEGSMQAIRQAFEDTIRLRDAAGFDALAHRLDELLDTLRMDDGAKAAAPPMYTADEVSQYLLALLEQAYRHRLANRDYSPSTVYVIEYIHGHYGEKPSINAVAQKLNANAMYVGQKFKKETGSSFNDYLTKCRIQMAEAMLVKTNMKIVEISRKVGISNSHYFSKLFRQVTGLTPGEYRKRHFDPGQVPGNAGDAI